MRFLEGTCPSCDGYCHIEQENLTFPSGTMFCWKCGKEHKVTEFNLRYIDEVV